MSKKPFDKFINKKESGAKKREKIRQEKKQLRAEKNAYFEELKRKAKAQRMGNDTHPSSSRGTGPKERISTHNKLQGSVAAPASKGKAIKKAPDGPRNIKPVVKATKPEVAPETRFEKQPARSRTVRKSIEKPVSPAQKAREVASEMPLNKLISWSGVCSRREAADLIKNGKVTVNGKQVLEPPFRVTRQDEVKVNGKKISVQKNLVYILLNKPKDYITTTDDPEGRKTVMDLIKNATNERVFPVGRLDRNTTGVLLLTNDGEVAQRLTHPKYEVKKIYEVKLDKPVTKQQMETIAAGITLEDGFIQPDAVAFADAKDKSVVGIEIHSGRNRIVRRIFEHMGFDVKNLDRVMYGIFTKKNVDRGKWRFLSEKEIRLLKHLNTSFSNKKTSKA